VIFVRFYIKSWSSMCSENFVLTVEHVWGMVKVGAG